MTGLLFYGSLPVVLHAGCVLACVSKYMMLAVSAYAQPSGAKSRTGHPDLKPAIVHIIQQSSESALLPAAIAERCSNENNCCSPGELRLQR